ncbi:prepilin-type N-terminal cleavage/methylation domain-containing protein [Hydrogenophaga electricum]|uniref:Prepilin-type N-terminal cleavage/methylation domain-containing protein n=1 Tax=Hydrogenophaga electricum TaxID=1230953 RepID=A0ABQ6C6X7_9BURK|nr:prepilin-type N-terminal cleavage/methylation domain-containing protein [Hydrogenophaga electricum]GLS15961.1 prepilin-type N-terminal cleavage/methylation domain-containing protein [Hydrogenophaga electricum]
MTHQNLTNLRAFGLRRQQGFSLLELTIALLAIGLLLGAAAVGRDLQRTAANQRLSTDFVQGWQLAYEAYINGVGYPPGDNATTPTGQVNANTTELCGNTLINAFLAAGIRLPEGRAEGMQDRYAYLDSNGNPQEVQVCFQNVAWAEPGATVGTYVSRQRNVMVLKSVTYSLAGMLDQQIDGRGDARFGRLRDASYANSTAVTTGQIWPIDDRMAYGTTTPTSRDEDQVAVTTAWFQMMQ